MAGEGGGGSSNLSLDESVDATGKPAFSVGDDRDGGRCEKVASTPPAVDRRGGGCGCRGAAAAICCGGNATFGGPLGQPVTLPSALGSPGKAPTGLLGMETETKEKE